MQSQSLAKLLFQSRRTSNLIAMLALLVISGLVANNLLLSVKAQQLDKLIPKSMFS